MKHISEIINETKLPFSLDEVESTEELEEDNDEFEDEYDFGDDEENNDLDQTCARELNIGEKKGKGQW